jgi:predicted metal-dependent phosphotriesterase family hydrolase
VVTVLGEIDPADLGVTMAHEHLFVDNWAMTFDYDFILDSEPLAIREVDLYRAAGGGAICDTTSEGIGRNPEGLARMSQATGVHVIMGAGWYREAVYPGTFDATQTNELAAHLVDDLLLGRRTGGIRAGFIGEIGTERGYITARQERMFRAAARAQRATGCPIATHTTHWGELGLEQIALLTEEGVPPDSIIIGHLGDRFQDEVVPRSLPPEYGSASTISGSSRATRPLEVRADNIANLWRQGFGEKILLASDICNLSQLHEYGGPGYANVIENFLDLLRERGLGDAEIDRMLISNPAEAFSYTPRVDLNEGRRHRSPATRRRQPPPPRRTMTGGKTWRDSGTQSGRQCHRLLHTAREWPPG